MTQTPDQAHPTEPTEPSARADELRDLAGPVAGWDEETGRHAEPDAGAPADSPDARTDSSVDEVRAAGHGDEETADLEDQYGLRSMPANPNPTDQDPASNLNF